MPLIRKECLKVTVSRREHVTRSAASIDGQRKSRVVGYSLISCAVSAHIAIFFARLDVCGRIAGPTEDQLGGKGCNQGSE